MTAHFPLQQILAIVGEEIASMWWFFLLAIVLVGVIKGYRLDLRIRDSIRRAGPLGIVLAVAVGMVSPLCACGILPVVISLAMLETPLAPLIALLVTSPVMGPDALLLTWRGLGGEFALLKLGGAAVLGLSAGFCMQWLVASGFLAGDQLRLRPLYRDDGSLASAAEIGAAGGDGGRTMTIVPRASRLRFILDRTLDAGLFVGKYLLLAIVLEALLVTLVPVSWITVLAGHHNLGFGPGGGGHRPAPADQPDPDHPDPGRPAGAWDRPGRRLHPAAWPARSRACRRSSPCGGSSGGGWWSPTWGSASGSRSCSAGATSCCADGVLSTGR